MADPITLTGLLIGAVCGIPGGVLANRADSLVCRFSKELVANLTEVGVPRNHDALRAMRLAQLDALGSLARALRAGKAVVTPADMFDSSAFLPRLDKFLQREEVAAGNLFLTQDLSEALAASVDATLAAPSTETGKARLESFAAKASSATWDEVNLLNPPPAFRTLFEGGEQGVPSWFQAYGVFLGQALKKDAGFRAIFTADRLANILSESVDLRKVVDSFIADSDRRHGELTSMLARIERQIQTIPTSVQEIVEASNRAWHGIPSLTGSLDPSTWADRFRDRPTNLLLAPYRIVEFLDRGGILAALLDWAMDRSGRRAQGRLYVASGGSGKTRLGIELIDALAERGWRCTFLSAQNAPIPTSGSLQDLFRSDDAQGVCIVIDYPEGQYERFQALADAAFSAATDGPPIRLVAFARSAAGWWNSFCRPTGSSLVFDPTPFGAAATALTEDERATLFVGAKKEFLKWLRDLGLPFREEEAMPDLTDADRPLSVIALAFLSAHGVELDGKSVFETLYQEERRHWERVLGVAASDAPEIDDLARAATQITLLQGASRDGAMALIRADGAPYERVLQGRKLVPPLMRLYGAPDPSAANADTFIKPIEPDLLGEHIAMRVLQQHRDDLIVTTMRAVLGDPSSYPNGAQQILAVLSRATRPEHDKVVQDAVGAAVAGLTEAVPLLSAEFVRLFGNAMPQASVALSNLSVVLASRLVDLSSRDQTDDALSGRALSLHNLGVRLQQAGRDSAAITATEEAVAILRELVGRNRDLFLPNLAQALYNLSARYAGLGHDEAALAATEESVTLYRELIREKRDTILVDFALALTIHGHSLLRLGHHVVALAVTEEAVEFLRELVGNNRDEFLPFLTAALINHSNSLADLDRHDAALTAIEEAVAIQRQLVRKNRDAYLPELVAALNNLGSCLSDLDQGGAGLAATEEAVKLSRTLVAKNRDAFLLGLAVVLASLGKKQSTQGDLEGALATTEEVVAIRRELVIEKGDGMRPDLAHALNNHGGSLFAAGHYEAALAASEESVTIYRELVATNRDRFLPDLGMALRNAHRCLAALGRHDAAFAAIEEAAQLYRELVGKSRDEFLPDLTSSLAHITNYLCDRGRGEMALAAAEEGTILSRRLVAKDRDRFLRSLASFLGNFGNQLSKLGRREAALAADKEAVQLYRELVVKNRDEFLPDLAQSLASFDKTLSALGHREEARSAAEEAVHLYRELAGKNRDLYLARLAAALSSLGIRLYETKEFEAALAVTREDVNLERELVARDRDAFLSNLAGALTNLCRDLFNLRRINEAQEAIREGIEYHREILAKDRNAQLPRLVEALSNAAICHSEAGRLDLGLAAALEAVELGREAVAKDPDGSSPQLARSLANYGNILSALGHPTEAKEAWADGARLMRPLAMRFPDAFGELYKTLRDKWFQAAHQAAGQSSADKPTSEFNEGDRLLATLLRQISENGAAPTFEGRAAVGQAADELVAFLCEWSGDATLEPVAAAAALVLTDLSAAAGEGEGDARGDADRAEVFLNWRRGRMRIHPDNDSMRSELAREIHSAWEDANNKGDRERCSRFLIEMRDLAKGYPHDSVIREGLARLLLFSGDDPDRGTEFLQELHDLREANPEDSEVRALDAWALHVESNKAAVQGDEAHRDMKLDELRNLSVRYIEDTAIRVPLAKSLKNNCQWAIEKSDIGRRDASLNELRVLNSCGPESTVIRRQLGDALYLVLMDDVPNGVANGSSVPPLLAELWDLVKTHPEDSELMEFFRSRFNIYEMGGSGQKIDPAVLI